MEWNIIGFVTAATLVWLVIIFNKLVQARNLVRAAFSDIDIQLVRRHQLIPSLVATTKAYMAHERATFVSISELRVLASRFEHAALVDGRPEIENALTDAVNTLLVLSEDYPDLKASKKFSKLQNDLVEIEDHIQHARRFYNGAVKKLNNSVQKFPDLLVAKLFHFKMEVYFSDKRLSGAPII